MSKSRVAIFWFRRDLRLHDNAGLYHALKSGFQVLPLFIFDRAILDELEEKQDRRVEFIANALSDMQQQLKGLNSSLMVKYGFPENIWQELSEDFDIQAVYTNHDYEPYAQTRDKAVANLLKEKGIPFHSFKDQVIFEKEEILSGQNTPYTVFTPYSRKWKEKLNQASETGFYTKAYPTEKYYDSFFKSPALPLPSLAEMGFEAVGEAFPTAGIRRELLEKYHDLRDFPGVPGTSRLSVHLRFGTVSIRELARKGLAHSQTWLNELIWRDFYQQILWNFPHVGEGKAFRPEYDRIGWRKDVADFDAWCAGKTGYPLVDAGMRELNATGFMHNRVRMVTASFLVKHLLIDWRWGEAYFAKKLLDYDLASNNGGWQWAAGSGTDAAPYFRIFNPTTQAQKFDPQRLYLKKWIPELNSLSYPNPMVDHAFARERCLRVYKQGLGKE
ncbi:cryptochrome/photolyase family protein [Arundinibacter roseus]|uniref:Deoxyribodipyrimidine photo-lyase n=1 Tax=Arundinibacter roseus TaxID=2070510 RepID=A0A4V2XA05_9BACT|nr:deoxyribodipyrimidine photo-lyase [Arundinibacter roseus]TDB65825.1 deoxyribodipyrimidine photo-lyase [Arundinibacter roseus]